MYITLPEQLQNVYYTAGTATIEKA